jgi:hypothetical protein
MSDWIGKHFDLTKSEKRVERLERDRAANLAAAADEIVRDAQARAEELLQRAKAVHESTIEQLREFVLERVGAPKDSAVRFSFDQERNVSGITIVEKPAAAPETDEGPAPAKLSVLEETQAIEQPAAK